MLDVAKDILNHPSALKQDTALANIVIDAPMAEFKSMEALVANSEAVSEAITVDEYNTVSTEDVLDADIIEAVQNLWSIVALRYSSPPQPPVETLP